MQHHLAVLYRTYITEIILGRKTVECRLGELGNPPHGLVRAGDLLWLKQVSGPVRAAVRVRRVCSVALTRAATLERVRRQWNHRILAPPEYWNASAGASQATLIVLGDVCAFRPFGIVKSDRRAWVVLSRPPIPGQPVRSKRG